MFQREILWMAAALVVCSGLESRSEGVTVKVIKVVETREVDLSPPAKDSDKFFGGFDQSKLAVTIELQGERLKKASQYGHIDITSATTDKGETLEVIPFASLGHHPTDRYESINRDFMYAFEQTKPTDRIKIDLGFKPCKRATSRIQAIQGTVRVLTVDRMEEITFGNIAQRKGDSLGHPVLKAANVTVRVTGIKNSVDALESVTLEIQDAENVIHDVYMTDENGKKLNVSSMKMFMGSKTMLTLQGWEKLPKDANVVVSAGVGQKTFSVPFAIKGVPLP